MDHHHTRTEHCLALVEPLARQLLPRLRRPVDFDELVQSGCLWLLEADRRFAGPSGEFEKFALAGIRAAMLQAVPDRRRAANFSRTLRRLQDRDGDPLREVLRVSTEQSIARTFEALPERQRTMLRMHYDSGVKLKAIGTLFGVSESRVSQILSEAVARLRAGLD
jgi:RNA polymerase sigma factor (sigma-70 family)